MCSRNDVEHLQPEETPMRELNLGPVANPDGSPTQLTRDMLAGTGRDPEAFAAAAPVARCGHADVHGAHWVNDGAGTWCAGNRDIVTAADAPAEVWCTECPEPATLERDGSGYCWVHDPKGRKAQLDEWVSQVLQGALEDHRRAGL